MKSRDISDELYREYDFDGRGDSSYRIDNPEHLFVGRTTHRVVDDEGIVHCVPAPGYFGCVLRWEPRDKANPVSF